MLGNISLSSFTIEILSTLGKILLGFQSRMVNKLHILGITTNQLIFTNRTIYYPLIIFSILIKAYPKALLNL